MLRRIIHETREERRFVKYVFTKQRQNFLCDSILTYRLIQTGFQLRVRPIRKARKRFVTIGRTERERERGRDRDRELGFSSESAESRIIL